MTATHADDLASRHIADIDARPRRNQRRWLKATSARSAAPATPSDEVRHVDAPVVYGVIIRADGCHHLLPQPVEVLDLEMILAPSLGTISGHHPAHPSVRLAIHVDTRRHEHDSRSNRIASALSGRLWPVIGDVVVTTEDCTAMPAGVVEDIVTLRNAASERTAAP